VLGRARGERFKRFPRKQLRGDREKEDACLTEIVVERQSCVPSGSGGGNARAV
jgi:hypothetical protein